MWMNRRARGAKKMGNYARWMIMQDVYREVALDIQLYAATGYRTRRRCTRPSAGVGYAPTYWEGKIVDNTR